MNDIRKPAFDPARRQLLLAGAGSLAVVGAALAGWRRFSMPTALAANSVPRHFEVMHTEAEWRQLLTPDQYAVLRQQATERAFSSPLDHEKRSGTFACAGERHNVAEGDVLFAAAGVEHRFEDFGDDFAAWVIFYGPDGGEAA